MSYDADDVRGMLGRRSKGNDPNLPSAPFKSSGLLRGLTGDRRNVGPSPNTKTAMLIDVEYDSPKVLLVTGQVSAPNEAGFGPATLGGPARFRITSGLDRAQLDEVITNTGQVLSRIFVARSVQVVGEFVGTDTPATVAAAIVPIDAAINAGDIIGLAESRGNSLRPDNGQMVFVATSTVAVSPNSALSARWFLGEMQRAGFAVYNTATTNLFIALSSDGTPANTTTDFTCKIVPGGYYEAPYGYSGPVSMIWDGASAGGASITWLGNQNGRTG